MTSTYADNEDGDDLIVYCLLLTGKHAAIESQQHMSHRGYRAQKALQDRQGLL